MKRILALSHLLVWAFQQHRLAAQAQRREPERRLVILFDEPETHLSPQWQRRLLPALMEAAAALGEGVEVQILVSTHAPLVLASVESRFDEARDRLFQLRMHEEEGLSLAELHRRAPLVARAVERRTADHLPGAAVTLGRT